MTERVYLPAIHNNAPVAGQGAPCGMTPRAAEFAHEWMLLLGDRANRMTCHPLLVECAQMHAEFLARREDTQPSMHIGEFGTTPNMRVRAAGYRLLGWHLDGNTVESCTRTWENLDDNMDGVVTSLMAHEAHHDHLWGIGWYEPSTVYGVGAASEPSGSTYFVVDACPPEEVGA